MPTSYDPPARRRSRMPMRPKQEVHTMIGLNDKGEEEFASEVVDSIDEAESTEYANDLRQPADATRVSRKKKK